MAPGLEKGSRRMVHASAIDEELFHAQSRTMAMGGVVRFGVLVEAIIHDLVKCHVWVILMLLDNLHVEHLFSWTLS